MSTGKPRPLKELLDGPDSPVGKLLARTTEVEALTSEVRRLVPAPLRPHIVVASIRDGTLELVTDAAVWAAQLRYHAADIRTSLTVKQGHSLQKVRVTVHAASSPGAI